jgi:molybdopterin converting factor subunit 1
MYKEELVKQSVSIKLFASLRQAMNSDEIKIDLDNEITVLLDNEITVLQMKMMLFEKFPNLEKSNIPFYVAVNHKYVTDSDVITTNDEIALIPPVSGG